MDLANLLINPSQMFAAAATAGAIGLFIWWLVRKKQRRVWLPTVRILEMETKLLPRMILQPPPWLAFVSFLICALVMAGFALKPRNQLYTPFEPSRTRIHIFADFSPSVSAYQSEETYKKTLTNLWQGLREEGRITMSTSHGRRFFEPENAAELNRLLSDKTFHRAGLKLGPAIKTQMEILGDVDRLFVVSDRDQHTWGGFNWPYLLDEMDVQFVDVSDERAQNVFISQVVYQSSPAAKVAEWDVEISRRGAKDAKEGRITATVGGKEMGVFGWTIPEGKARVSVRVSWPMDKSGKADDAIEWRLTSSKPDLLAMDDVFRSKLRGVKQSVLLISETTGEMLLDDPVHQLQISLEVLGFQVKRLDQLNQPGPDPQKYPFWIIVGGQGSGADSFCPRSLGNARRDPANMVKFQEQGKALPKVWLAPVVIDAEYGELCHCYARLMMPGGQYNPPEYCQEITARNHWLGLLPSLGAYQIGGELGRMDKTVAFQKQDKKTGLSTLAFTVPLRPSVQGFNHARFPILLKTLLTWQGMINGQGAASSWPRFEDIAADQWSSKPELIPNVPVGESLLLVEQLADMPPRFKVGTDWSQKQLPSKKDREDPLPWLRLGVLLVVLFGFVEALWGLSGSFIRLVKNKPALVLPLLLALGSFNNNAEASGIDVAVLGYPNNVSLQRLAREISHRTSLDLATQPQAFAAYDKNVLAAPWIWVRSLPQITQSDGKLRGDIAAWVKRGGLLILDGFATPEQLKRLTSGLVPERLRTSGVWRPIPPDHELMRSFYLLDALPGCSGGVWNGYHFDARLAILQIPMPFLQYLGGASAGDCAASLNRERAIRIFVNMLMVALATDYKKDQIHLPEILKRLR